MSRDATLWELAAIAMRSSQRSFPVVDAADHLVGVVGDTELLRGPAADGPGERVGAAMPREVSTARADELVTEVLHRVRGDDPIVVVDAGRPVGLLTGDAVGHYAATASSLRGAPTTR